MQSESKVIFERNSVEFVTVAAQYCQFLENVEGMERVYRYRAEDTAPTLRQSFIAARNGNDRRRRHTGNLCNRRNL